MKKVVLLFSLKCLRVEMSQQKVDKFLIYENDFQRFQCHGIILVHKRNAVYNMENQVPYNELIAPQLRKDVTYTLYLHALFLNFRIACYFGQLIDLLDFSYFIFHFGTPQKNQSLIL